MNSSLTWFSLAARTAGVHSRQPFCISTNGLAATWARASPISEMMAGTCLVAFSTALAASIGLGYSAAMRASAFSSPRMIWAESLSMLLRGKWNQPQGAALKRDGLGLCSG